jgi:hypothetical protein
LNRSSSVQRIPASHNVIIEHVPVADLPSAWQEKLHAAPATRVTVRIEEEASPQAVNALSDNPLFGMWRDREDMQDVAAHARKLRSPRNLVDDAKAHTKKC